MAVRWSATPFNAAVGIALGQAFGVQALDRSHWLVALCGDGGLWVGIRIGAAESSVWR
jgi:hypothetical protein